MPAGDTYGNFYVHPRLNVSESRKQSREIYEDVIYIEIKIKGDKNTSFSRPKKDEDEQTYSSEWSKFKTGEEAPEGTPLRCLPNISPAAEKNLNAQGIMCIEDLAELNDGVVIGVQGMVMLRKSAQAYIAALEPEKPKRKRRKRNKETGELE